MPTIFKKDWLTPSIIVVSVIVTILAVLSVFIYQRAGVTTNTIGTSNVVVKEYRDLPSSISLESRARLPKDFPLNYMRGSEPVVISSASEDLSSDIWKTSKMTVVYQSKSNRDEMVRAYDDFFRNTWGSMTAVTPLEKYSFTRGSFWGEIQFADKSGTTQVTIILYASTRISG